jgi:hypothetical protein
MNKEESIKRKVVCTNTICEGECGECKHMENINNEEPSKPTNPLDDLPIIGEGVLMEVSDVEVNHWANRYVIGKTKSGKFLAWVNNQQLDVYIWDFARPITPKTKITRKEFESKFEILD